MPSLGADAGEVQKLQEARAPTTLQIKARGLQSPPADRTPQLSGPSQKPMSSRTTDGPSRVRWPAGGRQLKGRARNPEQTTRSVPRRAQWGRGRGRTLAFLRSSSSSSVLTLAGAGSAARTTSSKLLSAMRPLQWQPSPVAAAEQAPGRRDGGTASFARKAYEGSHHHQRQQQQQGQEGWREEGAVSAPLPHMRLPNQGACRMRISQQALHTEAEVRGQAKAREETSRLGAAGDHAGAPSSDSHANPLNQDPCPGHTRLK